MGDPVSGELADLRVGTSGFSYRDGVGPFYPPGTQPRRMLELYTDRFDCVELNSTYYAIPSAAAMASLAARTGAGFLFTVKLPGSVTHQGQLDNLPHFLAAMAPLLECGRLAAFVAQFPGAVKNTQANRERVLRSCAPALAKAPVVVEFRHDSWCEPAVFGMLEEHGLAWCSVDEPGLPGLMPRELIILSGLAYLRFHSRDGERWWADGGKERYNYLYAREELEEWVPKIGRARIEAGQVFVFFNNCHAGHAARNARELLSLLGAAPPSGQGLLF